MYDSSSPDQSKAQDDLSLFKEYSLTKDNKLRNFLAEKYLYIAEIMAKKLANKGVEYDDLFQVSSLALLKAIDRFDADKGLQFSTFATPSILGELKNYFRDKSRLIRPGRKNSQLMLRINRAISELSASSEKAPTSEEIAQHLGISADSVIEAMEYNSAVLSLDQSVEEGGASLYEVIPDTKNQFDAFDEADSLKQALSYLTEEERQIVSKRFSQNMSQSEIARQMNVSQMFISRLERKIINKLKKTFENALND